MNSKLESIKKGVINNNRKLFAVGTFVGIALVGVTTWLKKDKIVSHFDETRKMRQSDDPETRKEGNLELVKGVVVDGLPIAASFIMAEACAVGGYMSAERAIASAMNAGMAMATGLGEAVTANLTTEELKRAVTFRKPYDDGEDGTIHDIQNQTAYVSARDALMRQAIGSGYLLAYFEPTGSYVFYKGNVDDLIVVANNVIDKIWTRDGRVSMMDVKTAFGIDEVGDVDHRIEWVNDMPSACAPFFRKRRPCGTHAVNTVMWEIYTDIPWVVTDRYYCGDDRYW